MFKAKVRRQVINQAIEKAQKTHDEQIKIVEENHKRTLKELDNQLEIRKNRDSRGTSQFDFK